MASSGASSILLNPEKIRRLSMQSLFESFDTLCEGTVIVDRDARIVWINERYATRLGAKSAAEAIGKPVEEVIHNSLMRSVVTTGQPILLDIMETPGATFVVTRIPLKNDRGEVIGAAGFALFDKVQSLKPLFAKFEGMQQEIAAAQKSLAENRRPKYTFSNFIGSSPVCMEVKRQARRAAQHDATVLLLGETGTGKELLAHAIHGASARGGKPFVGINVAAIPDALLETEFFGVAPGAYTGAEKKGRDGKFRLADGGTLFLDEIGDMPLLLQSKLLRVLQEQEFEPVGSNRVVKIDVRIIAATSVDLQRRVSEGRFREDLFYRLNVLSIRVPPLRERMADIEALCEGILEQIEQRTGLPHRELTTDAIEKLRGCAWRGNVRELQNVLEKAVMMSDKIRIGAVDLVDILPSDRVRLPFPGNSMHVLDASGGGSALSDTPEGEVRSYDVEFAEFERRLLANALAATGNRVDAAARLLGLGRATMYRKLRALGFDSHI
ncbi:sigma-54 interaction domain-containing protein [Propionivibrio dicarboxylicus]|uniref:Transcriptional regulator containing PAS, AAA-type ATPase, and DNA-binding Fis domains n=1 Tax=Propionivibrio dicarboxylicus TaxID=83767 RepID=A0A1G8GF10_9RHOO|nr:sigma 54-interacting transcriptional regulator [Propionivibrio dicarboxylicus]SDH92867.1 Transcriptional regulator containing PAS, AAA-type ATPase, and DNA-binding Fis domains [Propionivibrio dicarboxylicus]